MHSQANRRTKSRRYHFALYVAAVIAVVISTAQARAGPIEEVRLGYFVDQHKVADGIVSLNPALGQKINEIGQRLAAVANRPDLEYTFRVLNDPTINAFATAGGFIYINTGLLDVLRREDEVAAALAHELAHTNERHALQHAKTAPAKRVAGTVGGVVLGAALGEFFSRAGPAPGTYDPYNTTANLTNIGQTIGQSIPAALADTSISGYKKEAELQADGLAVQYLSDAGYDPRAMIRLLTTLLSIRESLDDQAASRYASHLFAAEPGLDARISTLQSAILDDAAGQFATGDSQ